jgi:hypothetical protein
VGVTAMLVKLKKVWAQSNESVAVYSTVGSGAPEYVTVSRLKNGLKELSENYRKPLSERYDIPHGEGAWKSFLQDIE